MIQRLFREPHRFDFFQAVRLLELMAGDAGARRPVGRDESPHLEAVRFRAAPAHSFPATPIRETHHPDGDGPPEMVVSSIGLTGPNGVLPDHYTALVIERLRLNDAALRDFLDLFNHRTISLYYRAWQKSQVAATYEQAHRRPGPADPFTQCLFSLVGRGHSALRNRMTVDDEIMLLYGGFFCNRIANAANLNAMVSDCFQVPAAVVQFQGQWLQLSETDRSRLTTDPFDMAACNRLGVDAVVGERIWDVQGVFRLRIGPLPRARFEDFMPNAGQLRQLCELTRAYVGPEYDFDVQVLLYRREVPPCRLSFGPEGGARLGWNTWMWSESFTAPNQTDGDEAVSDVVFRESLAVSSRD